MNEVIVKFNGSLDSIEAETGIKAEQLGDNYAILTLSPERIPELYHYSQIEYIELPKTLTLSMRRCMDISCITPVNRAQSYGDYGLTGRGVLIGIIDSGVDYTHPDFINDDGSSRILYLWNQLREGRAPEGFIGGTEYNNAELNAALRSMQPLSIIPSTDVLGHGTAVAGIAAGNARASAGREQGAAPNASLIVVKLGQRGRESFARTTEIMRALKYIVDKATALNMPVAINLSFGTNNGSHSGDSLFETYIDSVSRRWKTVIVAATGNEGYAGHHFAGKFQPGRSGQAVDAAFNVSPYIFSMYLAMWKNFSDNFDIRLIEPGDSGGTEITKYYGQPSFYNQGQEIFFSLSSVNDRPITSGIWRLLITGRQVVDGEFHIWLPTVEEVGTATAFLTPDPELTLTLPSTAETLISVGGYNGAVGSAADFSGRGYTYRRVYTKPDLVAPAVNIISTRTTYKGAGYDTFSGTSMAAPFVTGAAALMMEWGIVRGNDPFLYGQRVKAFLQKGATRNTRQTYPNRIWGYGALCLKATMDYLRENNQ